MIAVDTNILVYAHRRDCTWHLAARACVDRLVLGNTDWMISWTCIHEFVAITTHPRIYSPPSLLGEALEQIKVWKNSPFLRILGEGPTHFSILQDLMERGRAAGPMVYDARIAAICLESGSDELWTADRDFSRFAPLKVVNPLVSR